MSSSYEPCLCGDPYCGRCFPQPENRRLNADQIAGNPEFRRRGPFDWDGPHFKQKTIKKTKGRKRRAAAKVVKSVRAQVVARDGYCRPAKDGFVLREDCEGKSEWAHLPDYTRAKTRGKAPEERHTTAGTIMACTKHHDQIDGRRKPKLIVTGLDLPVDANGELAWCFADVEKITACLLCHCGRKFNHSGVCFFTAPDPCKR